jgi:hypothetical protein
MPFQLLLMLGLAGSSDCWIEKPLRAATWSAEPFNSFFAGAMGVAAAAALIGILAAAMKGRFFLGTSSALQNEPHCVDQHFIERCNLFAEPESVHSEPGNCGSRATNGKPMVYLAGNSHIHQLRHASATYSADNGLGLTVCG